MAEATLDQEEHTEESTAGGTSQELYPDGASGQEQNETQQDEGTTPSSFAELAQHLEVESEYFNDLTVPVKVNGTPAEATMQDLVNSYQTQEAATQILEDAKAKRQSSHQELAQERESVQTQMGVAGGLIMLAEQAFQKELSDADLASLRDKDKDQYLMEKDRLAERRTALDAAKQQIVAKLQEFNASQSAANPEVIASEQEALIKKIPDLEPQENRVRLAEYIMTQGFTREDISNTADHKLYVLAEKARLYDELQSKRRWKRSRSL